jgi:hypothetical protein
MVGCTLGARTSAGAVAWKKQPAVRRRRRRRTPVDSSSWRTALVRGRRHARACQRLTGAAAGEPPAPTPLLEARRCSCRRPARARTRATAGGAAVGDPPAPAPLLEARRRGCRRPARARAAAASGNDGSTPAALLLGSRSRRSGWMRLARAGGAGRRDPGRIWRGCSGLQLLVLHPPVLVHTLLLGAGTVREEGGDGSGRRLCFL